MTQQDPLTQAIQRNPCSKCRAMRMPVCKCGGGRGGSEDNDNSDGEANKATASAANSATKTSILTDISTYTPAFFKNWALFIENTSPDPHSMLTLEQIARLVTVDIDYDSQTLTFRMREGLSEEESKSLPILFKALKLEFDAFKSNLETYGIRVDSFDIQTLNNQLIIHIPTQRAFQMFIEQLMDHNLLPTETTHSQASTPFAMKPSPSSSRTRDDDKEKEATDEVCSDLMSELGRSDDLPVQARPLTLGR
jgi:hypothetical protein